MEDLKTAMKAKDTEKLTVLRSIQSAIKNEQIAKKKDLTDEEIGLVIARGAKQRRDSIAEFKKGDRADLVEKEEAELKIIEANLPEQMSEDNLKALIAKTISDIGAQSPSDMGKVMGKLMPQITGKADGSLVSKLVQEALNK